MPEVTVASFNIHWGRGRKAQGWREFDVVAACESIDADVLVLQESWAPDDGPAQHHEVATALGMDCIAVPMARAVMEPSPRIVGRPGSEHRVGDSDWSLALLSRKPIRTTKTTELFHLPFDPWARVLLEAEIDVDGANLTLVATHFSHLEFGSPLQTRALRRSLPASNRPGVLLGDMNMWGWTISAMAPPGWRRAVRGKTWPAHRPMHQIDHVLVTPNVEVVQGEALPDLGSDHRPVRARLRLP